MHLAYEFHMAPSEVLAETPRMQSTMHRYLRWRAIQMNKPRKGQ